MKVELNGYRMKKEFIAHCKKHEDNVAFHGSKLEKEVVQVTLDFPEEFDDKTCIRIAIGDTYVLVFANQLISGAQSLVEVG